MCSDDFVGPPCEMVDGLPDIRGTGRIEVPLGAGADGNTEASQLVHHVADCLTLTLEDAFERFALDGVFSARMLVLQIFF